MKRWHVAVLVMLLIGTASIIVSLSPGNRVVKIVGPGPLTPIPTPTPSPVTLLFVGDIMLSRSVGDLMVTKNNWIWPFEQIAATTKAADLTFGNLETTISTRGVKSGCGFCFRADPRSVQGLVLAGFDVMSVANNHVWDYGAQAFTDTLGHLASAGIEYVGGGRDAAQAHGGVIRMVRDVRIGYLAYTDLLPASAQATSTRAGVSLYNSNRMQQDIQAMRPQVDVLVVSFHGGVEYELTHTPRQEQIYHAAIDAGADLVIGTHPHVIEEIEHYQNGWIAYSLGNFVFDQNFSEETMRGLMVRATIQDKRVIDFQGIPVAISREYQPSLAP